MEQYPATEGLKFLSLVTTCIESKDILFSRGSQRQDKLILILNLISLDPPHKPKRTDLILEAESGWWLPETVDRRRERGGEKLARECVVTVG